MSVGVSGEKGIRTLGPQKEVNGFRDRPVRPLRHLSVFSALYGNLVKTSLSRKRMQRYNNFSKTQHFLKSVLLSSHVNVIHTESPYGIHRNDFESTVH